MYAIDITELDLSQNIAITCIGFSLLNVETLDFLNLAQLESLDISRSSVKELNLTGNAALRFIILEATSISDLDLSMNPSLLSLSLYETTLNDLDFSNNPLLGGFELIESSIRSGFLDFSKNEMLEYVLICDSNVEIINSKNGKDFIEFLFCDPDEFISYICVEQDFAQALSNQLRDSSDDHIQVSSFCTFDPGGEVHEISGNIFYGSPDCDLDLQRSIRLQVTDGIDSLTYHTSDTLDSVSYTHLTLPTKA